MPGCESPCSLVWVGCDTHKGAGTAFVQKHGDSDIVYSLSFISTVAATSGTQAVTEPSYWSLFMKAALRHLTTLSRVWSTTYNCL